jgi:hypothetical protein
MNWRLEVEEVACVIDDMKKIGVFTFLSSVGGDGVGGGKRRVQDKN